MLHVVKMHFFIFFTTLRAHEAKIANKIEVPSPINSQVQCTDIYMRSLILRLKMYQSMFVLHR
jgi:hypothetical protein